MSVPFGNWKSRKFYIHKLEVFRWFAFVSFSPAAIGRVTFSLALKICGLLLFFYYFVHAVPRSTRRVRDWWWRLKLLLLESDKIGLGTSGWVEREDGRIRVHCRCNKLWHCRFSMVKVS